MDIKQRDMHLLLALDVLLREQSVTTAADRLGLSQPAMSAQLKRLRELFNDPLLTQTGRKLVPTARALEIQDLRAHLQGLDGLVRDTADFDPMRSEKTFRVIATDYTHDVLAPRIAESIMTDAPASRLAFLPFDPKTLWALLENDDADFALVTGMNLPEAIRATGFREGFCVAQRKGHPRGVGKMDLEAFCALDHVLISPEGVGFVGAADKVLKDLGRIRRIAVSLPSFLLAPSFLARTDYICLLPKRLAALNADRIDVFEAPIQMPEFQVDLLWHVRRQHDPAHIWFRRRLRELMATL